MQTSMIKNVQATNICSAQISCVATVQQKCIAAQYAAFQFYRDITASNSVQRVIRALNVRVFTFTIVLSSFVTRLPRQVERSTVVRSSPSNMELGATDVQSCNSTLYLGKIQNTPNGAETLGNPANACPVDSSKHSRLSAQLSLASSTSTSWGPKASSITLSMTKSNKKHPCRTPLVVPNKLCSSS